MEDFEITIQDAINLRFKLKRETLAQVAEVMLTAIDDRFEEQSAGEAVFPLGTRKGAWNALATSTKNRKGHSVALVDSGAFRKGFSYIIPGDNQISITNNRTTPDGKHSILMIAQHGVKGAGRKHNINIEARPVVAFQQEEIDEMVDIILDAATQP